MEKFIKTLKNNLKANGFPEKKVAFNIETIYEKCDDLGFSFNSVISKLNEEEIQVRIEVERVIFSKLIKKETKDELFAKAQDMMSKMSSEEIQNIQNTLSSMTDDQKNQMMEQAKKMGLF